MSKCENLDSLKKYIVELKGEIMSRLISIQSLKSTMFKEIEELQEKLDINEKDYD